MASPLFLPQIEGMRRKPPASAQFNWLAGVYEVVPEQLDLEMPVPDDAILPDDSTVTLLATENGAQLKQSSFPCPTPSFHPMNVSPYRRGLNPSTRSRN